MFKKFLIHFLKGAVETNMSIGADLISQPTSKVKCMGEQFTSKDCSKVQHVPRNFAGTQRHGDKAAALT